jgi:uncharacterized membrane protein (UPF0127 family)
MGCLKRIQVRSIFLVSLAIGYLLCSCKPNHKEEMKSRDWSFENEASLYLINQSQDTLKQLQIKLADTDYSIQLGMMYREELTEDQGMLFVFEEATPRLFYMKNTEVPLDIIYITTDKRVDSYSLDAQPKDETLLESKGASQYVLEVKAGMANKWGLKENDLIDWKILNK